MLQRWIRWWRARQIDRLHRDHHPSLIAWQTFRKAEVIRTKPPAKVLEWKKDTRVVSLSRIRAWGSTATANRR